MSFTFCCLFMSHSRPPSPLIISPVLCAPLSPVALGIARGPGWLLFRAYSCWVSPEWASDCDEGQWHQLHPKTALCCLGWEAQRSQQQDPLPTEGGGGPGLQGTPVNPTPPYSLCPALGAVLTSPAGPCAQWDKTAPSWGLGRSSLLFSSRNLSSGGGGKNRRRRWVKEAEMNW